MSGFFFCNSVSFVYMFANNYLLKNQNVALISEVPDSALGLIIVIPCLNEPDILQTLESLNRCKLPAATVEVIVLINHSEIAGPEVKESNKKTYVELQNWIEKHSKSGLRFYAVLPVELRKKWAGAGLARKKGMDEAVRRFNLLEKENGIIVSLDADTLVDPNYLVEIENHFRQNPKNAGATLDFEHQKDALSGPHNKGIELYEKYLRYYKKALQFTGYPYAMVTIGSAFAVQASAYVKRGGMNRRQAGEDFYFLQNLVQIGTVGEITATKVYPSARLSDRVPFGTGPVLNSWMRGEGDLRLTYNFKGFLDLKTFFDRRREFYDLSLGECIARFKTFSKALNDFLENDRFCLELDELSKNCSTAEVFQKRFFQKFNAFKILKYLNFVSERFYPKADLEEQIKLLDKSSTEH